MSSVEYDQTTRHLMAPEELATNVINEDLAGTDVYATLNTEQRQWLHRVAGPLLVQEGAETALAAERAHLANPKRQEERLVSEVEDFLRIGRAPDDLVEGE